MSFRYLAISAAIIMSIIVGACGSDDAKTDPATAPADGTAGQGASASGKVLYIGGIPDQNVATLERQFELMASYLSDTTGLDVRFAPAADYAAIVVAFNRGDVHLVWFGGLTGVQARAAVPGSTAIAQRPRDTEFHSKFIVQAGLDVTELEDLNGLTFTFGSESSTSGHLMPRHFLVEAGIDPDEDFDGVPSYSGSHDKTYKLVESGAFQAGVLNEAVWDKAVADGLVDTSKVVELYTTPAYFDYNWTIHAEVDEIFGDGTTMRVLDALLALSADDSPEAAEMLELWATDRFIASQNSNYDAILEVATNLGIIQ